MSTICPLNMSTPLRAYIPLTGYIVPRVPTAPGLGAGPRPQVGRGAAGAGKAVVVMGEQPCA